MKTINFWRKILVAFTTLIIFTGCQSTTIVKVTEGGKDQYYTIVRDPESAFSIVSKDVTDNASIQAALKKLGTISASNNYSSLTQMLADKLDQGNSQIRAQFQAALFGLNANPTSEDNRKAFWSSLDNINQQALDLRLAQINEGINQLKTNLIAQAAAPTTDPATKATIHSQLQVLSNIQDLVK
jgi:hypothetical protein